jgi:hypothetical protein
MTQTYPAPITPAMLALANPNAGKPRYNTPADWIGGVQGDDVAVSTANVAVARSGGGANEPDYAPRTQVAKAGLANLTPGTVLAQDVSRKRGWIATKQPYSARPVSPAGDPTITSLTPATAVHGAGDVMVVITGTNFTPYSDIYVGGSSAAYKYMRYISPTEIDFLMDVGRSVAGTASVQVFDHGVLTAATNFTFT